jgi:hypothetical protein
LRLAQGAQRHVHIPDCDVDAAKARGMGRIAGNIYRALPMPDDPQATRPARLHEG